MTACLRCAAVTRLDDRSLASSADLETSWIMKSSSAFAVKPRVRDILPANALRVRLTNCNGCDLCDLPYLLVGLHYSLYSSHWKFCLDIDVCSYSDSRIDRTAFPGFPRPRTICGILRLWSPLVNLFSLCFLPPRHGSWLFLNRKDGGKEL